MSRIIYIFFLWLFKKKKCNLKNAKQSDISISGKIFFKQYIYCSTVFIAILPSKVCNIHLIIMFKNNDM